MAVPVGEAVVVGVVARGGVTVGVWVAVGRGTIIATPAPIDPNPNPNPSCPAAPTQPPRGYNDHLPPAI